MASPEKQTKERCLGNKKSDKENIRECRSAPTRKKTPTKTKEFKFATDSRIHANRHLSSGDPQKPFAATLRERIISPNYSSLPTLPNPFKFMLKRKLFCLADKQEAKWESMAESTLKFHTSRFANSSIEDDETLVAEQIKTPSRARTTVPVSPKLRTKERARNRTTRSKNMEKEEVDKTKRFVTPPSEEKEALVPEQIKTPRIRTTIPVSPKLRTKERARNKKAESGKDIEEKEMYEMNSYQFKTKQVNQAMIEMKGAYDGKEIPASYTVTNFYMDQRLTNRKSGEVIRSYEEHQDEEKKSYHSQQRKKFTPTKVKPFSFEDRDKERYMRKEEKIKKYKTAAEKIHEFHARSLPQNIEEKLPCVAVKRVTKPQPFQLSERSQAYRAKLEEKLKLEEEEEKAKRRFKAQPYGITNKEPFHPVKGLISPTSPTGVNLHSECRAKQRAEFEQTKDEKEKNKSEMESKLEQERMLEEKEEIKVLRKMLVHKASPIRTFKGLEIHPSNVPVTIPQGPHLELEKRLKSSLSIENTPDNFY